MKVLISKRGIDDFNTVQSMQAKTFYPISVMQVKTD